MKAFAAQLAVVTLILTVVACSADDAGPGPQGLLGTPVGTVQPTTVPPSLQTATALPTWAAGLTLVPTGEDPCVHPAVMQGGCVCAEHSGPVTLCAVVYAVPTRPEANTPTPAPTSTATSTPTPSPTAVPTSTATATPTPLPTPTVTPTAAPVATKVPVAAQTDLNTAWRTALQNIGLNEDAINGVTAFRGRCDAEPYSSWHGGQLEGHSACARGIRTLAELVEAMVLTPEQAAEIFPLVTQP